jgi:hypothetical protein
MKMVGLDLNQICKYYERNRENQKRKREEKGKNIKRPRGTPTAQNRSQSVARLS